MLPRTGSTLTAAFGSTPGTAPPPPIPPCSVCAESSAAPLSTAHASRPHRVRTGASPVPRGARSRLGWRRKRLQLFAVFRIHGCGPAACRLVGDAELLRELHQVRVGARKVVRHQATR